MRVVNPIVHAATDQLLDTMTGHGGGRGVHEARATFQIQPVDPLTCRVQDQVVLAAQSLERNRRVRPLRRVARFGVQADRAGNDA